MSGSSQRNYDLAAATATREFPAPRLDCRPPAPKRWRPRLALVGCGGISKSHLDAYRAAGWEVVALCDRLASAARARRDEFFPAATVDTDHRRLLERADIDVVDIALHPDARAAVIKDALTSGKHVLSQKPFVTDLAVGKRLADLADQRQLKLAVNQNGRWAPYARWLAAAVRRGLVGDIQSVAVSLNWDHTWIRGTPFEQVHDVVLYDFGIHWFDLCAMLFEGRRALSVNATTAPARDQQLALPLLASASVAFENGIASLHFDATSRHGPREAWTITGARGTLRATGPICAAHEITLHTKRGVARPVLHGAWFNDGFRGAMGELLSAIEQDREPENSARHNLTSLAICFAAVKSAHTGKAEAPDKIRRLPT